MSLPFWRTFDLASYVEQSLEVFQEEQFSVVWKFAAEAADEAMDYFSSYAEEGTSARCITISLF